MDTESILLLVIGGVLAVAALYLLTKPAPQSEPSTEDLLEIVKLYYGAA